SRTSFHISPVVRVFGLKEGRGGSTDQHRWTRSFPRTDAPCTRESTIRRNPRPMQLLTHVLQAAAVDVVNTHLCGDAPDFHRHPGGELVHSPAVGRPAMDADAGLAMRDDQYLAEAVDLHVMPQLRARIVVLGRRTRDLSEHDWIDHGNSIVGCARGRA